MAEKLLEREKSIETDQLVIKGNIMTWENTMLQLSNVSSISTYSLAGDSFPIRSIAVIVLGIICFTINALIAILLLIIGGVMIYNWYNNNERKKSETFLNIIMNSGNTISFMFNDKTFMRRVLTVLEQIIINGGIGNSNISINIKNNQFSGNAQVLNDLNIK